MYYTNFKHMNHNVETCRNKKSNEPIQTIAKLTIQNSQFKLVSLKNWTNTLAIFVAQEDISCQNAQDL